MREKFCIGLKKLSCYTRKPIDSHMARNCSWPTIIENKQKTGPKLYHHKKKMNFPNNRCISAMPLMGLECIPSYASDVTTDPDNT